MGSGSSKSSSKSENEYDSVLTKGSEEYVETKNTLIGQRNMPKKSCPQQFLDANTKNKDATGNRQRKGEFVLHHTINVKSSTDEKECFIEKIAIASDNELAIIDNNNKSLKIVNTDVRKIIRNLIFQSGPFGMTKISDNRVAVTLPSECKIEIICTTDDISVVQTLKTGWPCFGICYKNEKLYVSFQQKFQILRMTGAVQRTIKPCSDALKHYTYPNGMAVSHDEMSLFVSDCKSNKLIRIGLDGTLFSIYKDELDTPTDIFLLPCGSLYLLNCCQHCLYEVKADLSEATVVLGAGDGLVFPKAMFFDELKQQFYISSGSSDNRMRNELKVFEVE